MQNLVQDKEGQDAECHGGSGIMMLQAQLDLCSHLVHVALQFWWPNFPVLVYFKVRFSLIILPGS